MSLSSGQQQSSIVIPSLLSWGHADPSVCVKKLTVKYSTLASLLLGTKKVLETSPRLGVSVGGTLFLARSSLVHIHLVLDVSLHSHTADAGV